MALPCLLSSQQATNANDSVQLGVCSFLFACLFVCLFSVALHMEKEKVAKNSTDPEGCREQNTNEDVASKGDDVKPR